VGVAGFADDGEGVVLHDDLQSEGPKPR
jgi:hypothetical protein